MPRVASDEFGEEFFTRRDLAIASARAGAFVTGAALDHVGRWLDERITPMAAEEAWEHRQKVFAEHLLGQVDNPERRPVAPRMPSRVELTGSRLQVFRLELAIQLLLTHNQRHDLQRLLSKGLPHAVRARNGHRAMVVAACVLDADVGEWLECSTEIAQSPWDGNLNELPWVTGRASVCRLWGHEALALLEEACQVLGWEAHPTTTPTAAQPSHASGSIPTQKAWTRKELVNHAKKAAGSFSKTTFDTIRTNAGLRISTPGSPSSRSPYTPDELQVLIEEAERGPYQAKEEIASSWRELLGD